MQRLDTLGEILKKYDKAQFTILRKNGEEIFMRPLSASLVHEGIDKDFLCAGVSKIDIEPFLGVDFITVTLRY